jgi:aryl-alcohol dehydrogenase-like predicted oxidoreductase
VDTLDLVQLHCPPSAVIDADATYDALETLVAEGRIARYGVSVETCAQALSAIRRPNLASVQIILNAFRLKPLDEVLPAASEADVAIIARVPLASGLLSGRYDESTTFAPDDHRTFNRHGEAFDVGETFSGVDFEAGVAAARVGRAAARRDDRDPGRPVGRAGPRQRGRDVAAAAGDRAPRRRPRALRPLLPRRDPRPLVIRAPRA